jgi:hypothetical protein
LAQGQSLHALLHSRYGLSVARGSVSSALERRMRPRRGCLPFLPARRFCFCAFSPWTPKGDPSNTWPLSIIGVSSLSRHPTPRRPGK